MEQIIQQYYPGWTLMRKLGEGSFGTVYEIARNHYGVVERAAVKSITIPQKKSDIEALYSDGYDKDSIAQRFRGYKDDIVREYTTMAMLRSCPNVVHGLDHAEILHPDGIGWDILILMELLTPVTKCRRLNDGDDVVIRMGKDLCTALIECKNQGIIHRDIKPQNIFVSDNGTFKLGDFGISKNVERTTGGTKIGTYGYMAPEVYFAQPYGSSADVYSLGLVLYWMLNEHRGPFLPLPPKAPSASEEANARHRRFSGEPIPPPKNGSAALHRVVLKACAWDTKDRYHTAQEMYDDLVALETNSRPIWEQWLDEEQSISRNKTGRKKTGILAAAIAAVVLIAAATVGTVLYLNSRNNADSGKNYAYQSENTASDQQLWGVWEMNITQDEDTVRDILQYVEFTSEEIALVELKSMDCVAIVEFKKDGSYRFSFDVDKTQKKTRGFYDQVLDTLYENRDSLTESHGNEILEMSLEDFRRYFAELYGVETDEELLDYLVESSYDYDMLRVDLERGTYRLEDGCIVFQISEQEQEDTVPYLIDDDTLTLEYSDSRSVFTRQ